MDKKNQEQSSISQCPICASNRLPQEIEWVSKSVMDQLEGLEDCDHNETFICKKFINQIGQDIRVARRKKFNGYFTKSKENE